MRKLGNAEHAALPQSDAGCLEKPGDEDEVYPGR